MAPFNKAEVSQMRKQRWLIRAMWLTVPYSQVDALEYDALQVLSLVRSIKNTFAPINRTPPEVLSLIPDCLEDYNKDRNLITLTHICRSWRKIFVSRPSLWAKLNFKNVDKTRVYIERSRSAPLGISLSSFHEGEALLLAIPHIHRLKTLWVSGNPVQVLPVLAGHFFRPFPLLDKLKICFQSDQAPTLPDGLFNGDLSSLRELAVTGVITALPWRDLSNLTTFKLHDAPEYRILLTQLLDFFESAPYLCHIELHDSFLSSPDAPTERVVPLPHLKDLSIITDRPHSNLLNHLSTPAGASLFLEFRLNSEDPPIPSYVPESSGSLHNLSHITAVNLCFDSDNMAIQFSGPSGKLRVFWEWKPKEEQPNVGTSLIIQFLSKLDILRTRWLVITRCRYWLYDPAQTAKSTLYQILHRMEDLRTLIPIGCGDLPFIHTLNPDKNLSKIALCPRLEEIVFYIDRQDPLHVDELVDMTKERALRGAKLPAITVVSVDAVAPKQHVFWLKKHVSRVGYKFDGVDPAWDALLS